MSPNLVWMQTRDRLTCEAVRTNSLAVNDLETLAAGDSQVVLGELSGFFAEGFRNLDCHLDYRTHQHRHCYTSAD